MLVLLYVPVVRLLIASYVGGPTVEVQTAEEAKSLSRTGVV